MIIIPARLDSTRLPGKVLLPIDGKPMIHHVIDKCLLAGKVLVATDSQQIVNSVYDNYSGKVQVILTGAAENGTARVYQAIKSEKLPLTEPVINVQADHPFISHKLIEEVEDKLWHLMPNDRHRVMVAMMEDQPGGVRVLANPEMNAQWFTRMNAPGSYRHAGVYGYFPTFLAHYAVCKRRNWENIENLEQLRALDNGFTIRMGLTTNSAGPAIDTRADYDQALTALREC